MVYHKTWWWVWLYTKSSCRLSQDVILWKTTDVIPPSFSLATARCSWLEQFPASHVTGQICTTFCLECSYEFSIHTQLLLLRAYSKSCSYHSTKPTLRRVFISKKFGLGYEEDAVIQERSQEEVCTPQIPPSSPKVRGDKVVCEAATEKDCVTNCCVRLSRRSSLPRPRKPDHIVRLILCLCVFIWSILGK